MHKIQCRQHWARAVGLGAALAWFGGCKAQLPDVPREALGLIGPAGAIVFRDHADPLDGGRTSGGDLTLPQAVRLTLAHDPRIQISLAKVRVAEADANQARLLPNPILNIDVRAPVAPGSNTAFEATLTGDLVSLLQKPAQIAAADKRLRESASDALTTVLDVLAEVQVSYAAVQSLDAQLANARRRVDLFGKLDGLARQRLQAGDAVKLDVLTLDAQTMESAMDMSDLRLAAIEQRLNLARLIGAARSAADWRLGPWEAPAATNTAAESAWIDAALANRPEIQSRLWELKALGDDMAVAAFSPFTGGEIGAHAERDPEWRVGPTITTPLPIFDFGQASRAKVKAQQIAARHDLQLEQETLIQEVRLAYATWLNAGQTLADAQKKLLPLLGQQRDQTQTAYQNGDVDLATLLLAQNEYESAMARIILLQEKVTVARIRLQRAAGGAAVAQRVEAAAATQPATGPATLPMSTSQPGSAP